MKLRGKIFGSFEPVEFELKDVVGFHQGCIMVDNDTLQAPIIYDSIRQVLKENEIVTTFGIVRGLATSTSSEDVKE